MHPLGVVLVGCGRMGRQHLRAIHASKVVRILGVVDPDGVPPGETCWTLDQALSDPSVAGLVICAPTNLHREIVDSAIACGKHVLCEKPLTLDAAHDADLTQRATRNGLILQIGFWRRFAEPYRRMRAELSAGTIGRPVFMRFSQWDAMPPPAKFCDPSVSGGIAIDCGVHEFDLARWLGAGPPDVIEVTVPRGSTYGGDVLTAIAMIRGKDCVPFTIDLTRTAGHEDSIRTEILGTQGALVCDFSDDGELTIRLPAGVRRERFVEVICRALDAQIDAFGQAITSGVTHNDAATGLDARDALTCALRMRAGIADSANEN